MHSPTLESLCALLPRPVPVPAYQVIPASEVPEPFHQLLVHDRHMTISMEKYHRCKIAVQVLQSQRRGDDYARQIILLPEGTRQTVQGGIVRIHLSMLDLDVQVGILREDTPLGHVLINHDVLRHIEVTNYVRLEPGSGWDGWPGFASEQPAYGRLGILYCDLQPAIELFEVIPASSVQ